MWSFVCGNPPFQKESESAQSTSNGQKPMTNIFQYFQEQADELADEASVLVYPGGRWIHQSGKGVKEFGRKQINDPALSTLLFYPDASEVFGSAASLSDGITIVVKKRKKKDGGFKFIWKKGNEAIEVEADNPGEKLMPLYPLNIPIIQKVDKKVDELSLKFLHDAILPRSLFAIESDFAEKNPEKVRPLDGNEFNPSNGDIKLFTNDKAGKAGRATWFIANRDVIEQNEEYIDQWQVVVSSANAGGQKRDNQLAIMDNYSAFGRARLALRSFRTHEEALNFYNYVRSYLVRFMFLMTDEALSSLAKEVPDMLDYSENNQLIDYKKDIDEQLFSLFELSKQDIKHIKDTVDNLR